MDVVSIDLRGERPVAVTWTLDVREAAVLGALCGRLSLPGGPPPEVVAVYRTLVWGVFARFWQGGVDEALREFGIEFPRLLVPGLRPRSDG